jgi:hypothetical protein
MTRFVVGDDRSQSTMFPQRLDDYLSEDNPVRAREVAGFARALGRMEAREEYQKQHANDQTNARN